MGNDGATITVNGVQVEVIVGQSLTSVLKGIDDGLFARHRVTRELGQGFCGMGICFECEVSVDGTDDVRACLVKVDEGMSVKTAGNQRSDQQGGA